MTDNLPALRAYCKDLAQGTMIPAQYRGKPANVLYAVEYADALNIPRINAITSIHVIEGKPSASAELIAGLVRKAGHRLRVKVEGSGQQAVATSTLIRGDDPDFEFSCSWDMRRANAAGLTGKSNWQKYPEAMLKARAITEVAREGASDALMGVVYTPEELGLETDRDGNPVHVQSERVTTPAGNRGHNGNVNTSTADAMNTVLHGGQQQQQHQHPQARPAESADSLLQEAEMAEGDLDALTTLWRRAAALPKGDVWPVRAVIEALAEQAKKAAATNDQEPTPQQAAETVSSVIDAEVVNEQGVAA